MKKYIPISLIVFRLILAPTILLLVYYLRDKSRISVLILMYFGLISDILDGIIARRLHVSSSNLRRFDSQTDMIFWLSIGISTWILYPNLIQCNLISISIILILEVLCYIISIIKFRKETCTHAFLSKMWGLTLLVAFTSLLGFNHAGFPFILAIILGVISHIDRILITLILPSWTHDIPSFYHAYLIRKGLNFKRNSLFN